MKDKSTKIQNKPYPKISFIVLGVGLVITLISLIPVVFPALFSITVVPNGFEEMGLTTQEIDPFETGPLAGLLILSNVGIFGLYFFRRKIPKISKIFSFDISQKISLAIVFGVIVVYGSIAFSEVNTDEIYEDWNGVEKRLGTYGSSDSNFIDLHVRYVLLQQSMIIFGSYKIIPLFSSMALLAVTYLFTTSITQNRFSGLVSMILVLQSYVFLTYDTSSTYTNFWMLFYLLSLYAIVKCWFANPVFYVASLFSKILTAVFAPMSIFFILNSDLPKKKKLIISGIIIAILIAGSSVISISDLSKEELSWHEFWIGFTAFAFQMRFDFIVVLFLLPLIFGLFIVSKNNKHANSISILITGILFTFPLLTGLTDQTNQPYRFIPISIFFAVGVGILFSKTTKF